jgi:hypothetical protein
MRQFTLLSKVTIPRQSRGLYDLSRSKRLGVAARPRKPRAQADIMVCELGLATRLHTAVSEPI